MLKIFNTILFVACENSDGLMGFHYSHDGFWDGENGPFLGTPIHSHIKKMECANRCMAKGSCVAIAMGWGDVYGTVCYHYSNIAHLVSSNEVIDNEGKAYVKCSGTDV